MQLSVSPSTLGSAVDEVDLLPTTLYFLTCSAAHHPRSRGLFGLHFPACHTAFSRPRAVTAAQRGGGLHIPACPAAGAGPEPEPERRGLEEAGGRERRRQPGQPEPRSLGLRSAP